MLQTFSGALQADGYEGYNQFEHRAGITLLGCFAHVRRYFEKALAQNNQHAAWMLTAIQKLYLMSGRPVRPDFLTLTVINYVRRNQFPSWLRLKDGSVRTVPKCCPLL